MKVWDKKSKVQSLVGAQNLVDTSIIVVTTITWM